MRTSSRLTSRVTAAIIAALILAAGQPAHAAPAHAVPAGTATAAAPTAAAPTASGPATRQMGADRYETSAAISAGAFPAKVPVAYVATGLNFPDALSAAAAGGAKGGPVLLTAPTGLPAAIRRELSRLQPAKIIVLGGTGVVDDAVLAQLSAFTTGSVRRLTGADRYETSAAISANAFARGVPVAYIATGLNFPDALSGAAAGGAQHGPVLLTAPTALPAAIRTELARLKPARIVVLGGPDVVGDTVLRELSAYTAGSVGRITGADRYGTSATISARAFAPGVPVAYVATGLNFPDALSAAAAGGAKGGPVLLTAPAALPTVTRTELARLKPARIVVLGGTDVVDESVKIQLAAYATTAAANAQADGWFTIATYPDTQQEVYSSADTRFIDRSKWLVAHQKALDLRFVAHTGDVVNWDTDGHEQYVIARNAMRPLDQARIPYALSIGNHDTYATGPGGSAREPSSRTYEYQRITTTFNSFWRPADYIDLAGMFEEGKVDNTFSTFDAEGGHWLVINLELWPRGDVVTWAADVIASHPRYNVMIQTHSFLNANADIAGAGRSQTKWEYGDSSPQLVYDRLVAPYPNVKIVTSGHTGIARSKVVTTAAGNHVAYMLQAIHSNTDNPVRLSQIDVADGTITTQVYAPKDNVTWDLQVLSGLTFIHD